MQVRKRKQLSSEHKRRISESLKGHKVSMETRKKLSENSAHYWKGKHRSLETRKRMSEAQKGEKNPNYGKHPSLETRKKLSEAHKGEKHHFYGKHHSVETRRKISESEKGKHISVETRRRMSEAKKNMSVETRKKMSESRKGEKNSNWRGGISLEYGENWSVQRLRALQRDEYTCQKCGKTIDELRIDVHHIIPFRYFKDYKDANRLENLKCLCLVHHTKAEAEFRKEETNQIIISKLSKIRGDLFEVQ